ncbi:MAG: PleD family two-component system response regulator [Pseudomonadota bacterium]
MTARVLVVDDVETNVKLLQARLMAEYFEVVTASNGPDALEICRAGHCDIVLLDVMMPGMDGYEVCRRLKADPATAALPVVMVTALDQTSDRLAGLEAGADDFLTKPIDEIALMTRVKSLARLKMILDELEMRVSTGQSLGIGSAQPSALDPKDGRDGKVLIVDDSKLSYDPVVKALARDHNVAVVTNPQDALFKLAEEGFDLAVISLALNDYDALRLCSQIRSLDRTRNIPILLIAQDGDQARLVRGIDLGVNDYITRPVEGAEIQARARTQVRRKRMSDALRDSVTTTMEMAVKDPLTGLNNRRYFDTHMSTLITNARKANKPLSLIVLDIDHFKAVNDTYGHAAGDAVLKEFSERICKTVRGPDLACRFGGEEFVVALPDIDRALGEVVANRMRTSICDHPFIIDGGAQQIDVTVSAGIASLEASDETIQKVLERADEALYDAKRAGRNQVVAKAA